MKSLKKNKSLFIPYVTSGFPTKKSFLPILEILSKNGADFIEIGVPYSDPLADGSTIQMSSKIAVENGVTLKWIVQSLKNTKRKLKPLILFSYFNPIYNYGIENLLKELPQNKFFGMIIPDLPLEEAERYLTLFKKYNINLILLAAPTSKKEKLKKISQLSGGFTYLVSVAGVTGERRKIPSQLRKKIKELKSYTKKPVVVGFGISTPQQGKEIISYGADGIVVGSAIINILKNSNGNLNKLKKFISGFS